MTYSRIIQMAGIVFGIIYSLGYLSPRLRYVIEDQLPLVGIVALFIIGVCVGLSTACLFAPSSFLATEEGRRWMTRMSGTTSPKLFRSYCSAALLFFLFATYVVLHYTFVFLKE